MIRHLLISSYKAGQEWDPVNEPQIFFIKSGGSNVLSYPARMWGREKTFFAHTFAGLNLQTNHCTCLACTG